MFFIPIGHDQTQVRRFPVLSAGLVLLCTLCFAIAERGRLERLAEVERAASAMLVYADDHDVAFPPGVRSLMEYRTPPATRLQREAEYEVALETTSSEERRAEQEAFEALCARFVAAQKARIDRRFGLVPADLHVYTLLTHMFVHGGIGHLLGNMLFLFLAGFALEEVWGRGIFTALYLVSGLGAAALQILSDPHGQIPMVGASGAVAGLMGAFMVRCWNSQIRFFYLFWFGRVFLGTVHAPAWLMLPLWFASESAAAASGANTSVAHWAHVGGFLSGAGIAAAIVLSRVETRFIAPRIETKLTYVTNTAIERATTLEKAGNPVGAFDLLRQEVAENPDNHDAVLAFWDTAVRIGRAPHAARAFSKAIEWNVKHAHFEHAIADLVELEKHAPGTRMSVTVLIQLASGLSSPGTYDEAIFALEKAIADCGGAPPPALALRLGRAALVARPSLAERLATDALSCAALEERLRSPLEALLEEARCLEAPAPFAPPEEATDGEWAQLERSADRPAIDVAPRPAPTTPSKRAQEFAAFETGAVDLSAASDDPEIRSALSQEASDADPEPVATPFELGSTFDFSGDDDPERD